VSALKPRSKLAGTLGWKSKVTLNSSIPPLDAENLFVAYVWSQNYVEFYR